MREEKFHFLKKEFIKNEPISEIKDDLFNLEEPVNDFWNYINSYETPLVVGVYDSWGSGKSSFLKLVSKKSKDNFLIFEAWKYKDKKALWKALTLEITKKWDLKNYENLNEEYYYQKNLKLISPSKIISLTFIILIATSVYFFSKDVSFTFFVTLINFLIGIIGFFTFINIKKPTESYEEFESVYLKILENEKEEKYIIIEDLDRCLPKDAISLLEDLKGFFKTENSKFRFIIPIDLKLLEIEIQQRYNKDEINATEYLDKIIDIPYFLPSKDENYQNYISKILSKEGLKKLEEDYKKLTSNSNFIEFLDDILRITGNNTPRKTKKIFLGLDLAYHLIKKKEEINSITLLIIIIIKTNFPIGYEILSRVTNIGLYKEPSQSIDANDFLKSDSKNAQDQMRDKQYSIIANYLRIPNNPKIESSSQLLYENHNKIREFQYFIDKCNFFIHNQNKRDVFIPKKIELLKKYIYSTKLISKAEKIHMSRKEMAEEIALSELEEKENRNF